METTAWPSPPDRSLLTQRISRLDGPKKVTGRAQYAYDINLPGMLWAKLAPAAHARARIKSINLAAAESIAGVKAVWKDEELIGNEVQYIGQVLAAVAAETEEIAEEAVAAIQVDYEPLEHQVVDTDPSLVSGRDSTREEGSVEQGFQQAAVITEGEYGCPVITHCCMESHGQVAEVRDGELFLWPSTQNVSRYADRMDEPVGIPRSKMHVDCQYMGGGFGSKFGHDKWGIIGSLLAKQSGRPVKLMLDRRMELEVAGNRPSTYAKIKVGASQEGKITALEANIWGTGGGGGYSMRVVPYVFNVPNSKVTSQGIKTNRGGQRAWRAPWHPQACFLTMSAVDDAAAALGMDALEFFRHNLELTDRPDVYAEELEIAASLIQYDRKAHLRGDQTPGPIKRGLGVSLHTWGGLGHASECDVRIHPDGSVEAEIGTQDLGTGTRTVIAMVVAETLGLPLDGVTVKIGKSAYPMSGASGGSTTVGGVSTSSRLASSAARLTLLQTVAPHLGVSAEDLEAKEGRIRVKNHPANYISWRQACALLGPNPIVQRGTASPNEHREKGYMDGGVGGVQIADVSVDIETGVVTLNEFVAVQDCGLIIDMKTAESQVYGGMIMGITYALYEEAIYDAYTGRMLNADMEFYRLAGIQDIGKLKVHFMTGKKYEDRGVIGLGEPPVISPGAAISNAVANACGVRVPRLPLTPDRVIGALEKGGLFA